jgi:aminopeptidase N
LGSSTPFAEPDAQRRYAPDRPFRVLHADVRLAIDPFTRTWEGSTRFAVAPLSGFRGVYRFDLDGPSVSAVTGDDGAALPWMLDDGGLQVQAGPKIGAIRIGFSGQQARAGLYFVGPSADYPDREPMAWTQCQDEDAHLFMPCVDHPRVRHPWTVHLEGPAGMTLLSNGRRVAESTADARSRAEFEQAEPMPAYLFTAVVARLDRVEAVDQPVSVTYWTPPGTGAACARGLGRTPEMIRWLSGLLEFPYPWPRYDQVVVWDFTFGGMENVACSTLTDLVLTDDRTGEHWPADGLVVHELAHQWFGDLVTCSDWSQAWLNEGWATFVEQLWWEHDRGAEEATYYAWQHLQDYLDEDASKYRRALTDNRFKEPVDVFDRHLYEKGALVLRTLRTRLGDAAFFDGVRAYLRAHAHRSVHSHDFRAALEETSGVSLGDFFDTWVHGAGHPVLDVEVNEDAGLLTLAVSQRQSGEGTAEVFRFPLNVEIGYADGTRASFDLPIAERSRTWALPVDRAVAVVRVDPGLRILADLQVTAPQPMLERLAADACPAVASRAVRAIAKKGGARAVHALGEALAHPFWGVRAEVASLLARSASSEATERLARAVRSESEPRARVALATALGALGGTVAADALLIALGGPTTTWSELAHLLLALGKTRDKRAVAVLQGHLSTVSWGEVVQQKALLGLGCTEDVAVLDALLEAARPGRTERVHVGAAQGLAVLADAQPAVRRRVREALEALVREGGMRGRYAAVVALGKVRDAASVELLEAVHRGDPDGRTRRAAYEALSACRQGRGEPDAIGALRARLEVVARENEGLRSRLERLERP